MTNFTTDTKALAEAIQDFERLLPGWWWSIGQVWPNAHAACGPKGQEHTFTCFLNNGAPHEALRNVLEQAVTYLEQMEGK